MSDQVYEQQDWATPERQSPVAILLILMQFVTKLIKQFWPFLIVIFFRQSRSENSYERFFELFAVVVGVGSTLVSIISYFKFYFYVKDEELVIEKGIFQKTKLNIPFERIQTISFGQNPIHRFFNVVSLEVDTAGSKGKEFSILALKKEKAEAIRSYLIAQIPVQKNEQGEPSEPRIETITEETLLHLNFKDLLKIGVGQNHLRGLGIIAAVIFALAEVIDFGKKGFVRGVLEFFMKGKETVSDAAIWLYVTPALIVFLLVTSFLMTFLNYYDLRFLKTTKGFKVVAGFFNRKEQSAAMQKIQMIQWTTNPLKKIFEMYDIRLLQASSARLRKKQSFYVPGCYDEQLQAVRKTYMPEEEDLTFEEHRINRRIVNKRVMLMGFLPVIPFLISSYLSDGVFSFQFFLWTVVVIITSWIYWKRYRYYVSENGIRVQKGIFITKRTLLKYYKIQGAAIAQTIFQKRNGHADLKLFTAAGNVTIPYIEIEKAETLMNVVLWKIESTEKGWM
ncbi:MAG: PH domain-containing protein [Saprospiraceae bacterium]